MVEANGGDYATYLCNVFHDDPLFQAAARSWAGEEVQHGLALARWAALADPEFDFDACFRRFTDGYKIAVDADRSIRGSRSGELVARCIVETGTSSYYTALMEAADEPVLKEIFRRGEDVHAATAAEVLGADPETLSPGDRSKAKMINFGIVYGLTGYGLADRLQIPQDEAQEFIDRYLERFPAVRAYIDHTIAFATTEGYVTTLFGRICHYPQIRSGNPSERAGVERQAINAPIQGTAADIIRRAMIRMEDALKAERLSARMLLQVHDELVFEVPDDEVEASLPVISRVMTEAPFPAVSLKVPLAVDARAAQNWDEAH